MRERITGARVTVLYDNIELDKRLIPSHGFSCLVEVGNERILFDTGGNPAVLLYNMGALGVDPRSITTVFISHNHWDHVGGLSTLLSLRPSIRVSLPTGGLRELGDGIRVIGPVETQYKGFTIKEQALALETDHGILLIVGCSHPGIGLLVREALTAFSENRVAAVIGGLHLLESGEEKAASTARELLELGVEHVAPCHCSGKQAAEAMSRIHKGVLPCGVGASFSF